ncbi:hypothetical protein TVAG_070180 [Trichomonas vaginalis G3]|uniref:Uncharacterized protein n=1 Tax=Trichomonas vaginalis (strain ATCC PRA-98 / G3) TaxID=412133 RepID=A2D7S2_TRIV3|nr:spectrin binding [Trichomonas vaginalis G3]EAY23355.1 hypothetical protein TVAG_070180 [Trichomonas vaginalis G3]KAI5493763.1 spectrin binding [Trichomonas vaginalis G3]|eukprot:XP_001584341.1 hypothetical protein [Trichomonas vaginalis G3]
MSFEYLKKYDDYHAALENVFQIKTAESYVEVFNMITNVIISKYKMPISKVISQIFTAINYNYRSFNLYIKLINQILLKYSITSKPSKDLLEEAEFIHLQFILNDNNVYQITYDENKLFFPKREEIHDIFIDDDIDKFKNYIIHTPVDEIQLVIHGFDLDAQQASAYFGSVNIFLIFFIQITRKKYYKLH